MILGERIKFVLARKGWKQAQLARAIEHSDPWVSEILKKTKLQTELVSKIERAFGLPHGARTIGSDDDFLAAVEAMGDEPIDDELVVDVIPNEKRSSSGPEVVHRLSSLVDDGIVIGPAAYRHRPPRLRKRIENEHYMRSERDKAPPRTRGLSGVPPGGDVVEVRTTKPIVMREGGEVIDTLSPGDLLFVDVDVAKTPPVPESEELPGRLKRSLVLAIVELGKDEPSDDETLGDALSQARLFRYWPQDKVTALRPLGGDWRGHVTVEQGWKIVGVVVDRR